MSKVKAEVIDILYSYINSSSFMSDANKINGGLYKYRRPENSTKEDVTINGIGGLTRDDVQRGVLIVNIFVPNLDPTLFPHLNGDRSQPNTVRLLFLSKLFQTGMKGIIWKSDGGYAFSIQQDDISEDTNNQHYAWFRIEFYSINI